MKANTELAAMSDLVSQVLSISKEELARREKRYQERAAKNPHRRGPKPKRKVKASA